MYLCTQHNEHRTNRRIYTHTRYEYCYPLTVSVMALKVLRALDTAKAQFYHFQAIVIAGMGLFTDSYDLFCIPPIMTLIGHVYYDDEKNKKTVPIAVNSAMIAIALFGAVIGQLLFGRLGDRLGRRPMYGIALLIMVLSSFACGLSICTTRRCVLGSLGFFRFFLGVGIGGDYPLSATIMSEFANKMTRGAFIAAVFSMQGLGILVSSTVAMVVCAIFNATSHHGSVPSATDLATDKLKADLAWRILLMIGAIPAGITFYWRMKMPETARYTALVEQDVLQAAKDMQKVLGTSLSQIREDGDQFPNPASSYGFFSTAFFFRHGRDLFSCAATWFLVDIVFYSTNLVQSQINRKFTTGDSMNAFQQAYRLARFQAILAICSTIPGYYFTVFLIDRVGRVKIQMMGFFFMALALFSIGVPYHGHWQDHSDVGFLFLFGLILFFSNFGPNTTTFVVPAELFPARFRSTCHGISGAVGKVGAIIGTVFFIWASNSTNQSYIGRVEALRRTWALSILGGFCILGLIITYCFTRETMGRSLEENEKEEDEGQGLCCLRSFKICCMARHSKSVSDNATLQLSNA